MSNVLYDVPGPRAQLRNRILGVATILLVIAGTAFVIWRLFDTGQFSAEKWELFSYTAVWGLIGKATGATLAFDRADDSAYASNISGDGNLAKLGDGRLTVSGLIGTAGATGAPRTVAGQVIAAAGNLQISVPADLNFAGRISGAGTLASPYASAFAAITVRIRSGVSAPKPSRLTSGVRIERSRTMAKRRASSAVSNSASRRFSASIPAGMSASSAFRTAGGTPAVVLQSTTGTCGCCSRKMRTASRGSASISEASSARKSGCSRTTLAEAMPSVAAVPATSINGSSASKPAN